MLRQYHTKDGTYFAQPSDEELDMEWRMRINSIDHKMQVETMAELTGKDKTVVEETMKKNWLKAQKE